MENNKIKIYKWLLFTAIIAVFPLGLDYLFRMMQGQTVEFNDLVNAGQLFLVSTALAASGLGEILVSFKKQLIMFFNMLLLAF